MIIFVDALTWDWKQKSANTKTKPKVMIMFLKRLINLLAHYISALNFNLERFRNVFMIAVKNNYYGLWKYSIVCFTNLYIYVNAKRAFCLQRYCIGGCWRSVSNSDAEARCYILWWRRLRACSTLCNHVALPRAPHERTSQPVSKHLHPQINIFVNPAVRVYQ